ncbi:glycosyltransferase [Conyzicola sp.]|uniref:glycosyltransferase n=1 Tax=Conyzicola sp. TaxID=1969404 RepID=UPI003989AC96
MAPVDHAILTRFNLPSQGVESLIRAREGWLRTRVDLFERYCVPSVLAQTTGNFSWIIYFDPQSPQWLLDRVERHRAAGTFTPIFREEVDRETLIADIRRVTGAAASELITTNLDNDDGIATDFVQRLQAARPREARSALYLTRGLIRSGDSLYSRVDRSNAFCSVRESWVDPVSCWADWHNLLHKQMSVTELAGSPGWLQVVHGTNVSNRVHGTLTSPAGFEALFPGLLDDVPPVAPAALRRDRFINAPLRRVRDVARSSLKTVVKGVLGKDGFSRAKKVLGLRRRTASS